ncbi:MAG: hypothetical protein AAFY16_13820, partial [Cyanobacteria bacterium J06642_3]
RIYSLLIKLTIFISTDGRIIIGHPPEKTVQVYNAITAGLFKSCWRSHYRLEPFFLEDVL